MYLSRLKIRNFRCFKKLDLSMGEPTKPRMWTVLRGEAESGKTSLLQCAALPSVTSSYVSVLDPLLAKRQWNQGDCSIEATYVVRASSVTKLIPDMADALPPDQDVLLLRSRMGFTTQVKHQTFTSSSSLVNPVTGNTIRVRQQGGLMELAKRPDAPAADFWCAAYGTHRTFTRPGERCMVYHQGGGSRVRHLFRQEHQTTGHLFLSRSPQLMGSEVNLDRTFLEPFKTRARALVEPLFPGLPWDDEEHREDSPWYALSGGTESTVSWLLDLLWYASLSEETPGRIGDLSDLSGLAIVDGIDAGLSPSMQARLVPHLCRVLPKMQFIVSASSPALFDTLEDGEVVRL